MVIGEHARAGRGRGVDTGTSSLNLLARAEGAGERRIRQVLGKGPLLTRIVDGVELHAADIDRINRNVRGGEQVHGLADQTHEVSLLMEGAGVESLRRSESP